MNSWVEYAKKIWKIPALFLLFTAVTGVVFFLYEVPLEPLLYAGLLCGIGGLASFFYGHYQYHKKKELLQNIEKNLIENLGKLPVPKDELEAGYQRMMWNLNALRMGAEVSRQRFYEEMTDYYTMWVHQIKTPVAAMRLLLQEHAGESRDELGELFKIEQYVDMVLGYLRTQDISGDMDFQECSLDEIVRGQIHKFARVFVGKRLALEYTGVEENVLTDAKWLGFVIGQVLSNSLKYTKTGKIAIYMEKSRPYTLVIEDTGIGVNAGDVPRVFERGFTGHNGREDNRSTGIGLYLSAKIMKKLGHEIWLESETGKGTKVFLGLGRKRLTMVD